jgi:hypothetical protein
VLHHATPARAHLSNHRPALYLGGLHDDTRHEGPLNPQVATDPGGDGLRAVKNYAATIQFRSATLCVNPEVREQSKHDGNSNLTLV